MIILVIILLLIIALQFWFIYNLNSQITKFETYISQIGKRESKHYEEIEKYYNVFLKLFSDAYSDMQRVDKRGSFSSDDEVGFAFKVILSAIATVKETLENLRKDQE